MESQQKTYTSILNPSILNNQRVVKIAQPTSQKQIAVISK